MDFPSDLWLATDLVEAGEIRTSQERSSVRATFGALFRVRDDLGMGLSFEVICLPYPILRQKSRYFNISDSEEPAAIQSPPALGRARAAILRLV